MLNKRFNSKYAERGDIFDESELEGLYGGNAENPSPSYNPGYQIINPNETKSSFEEDQKITIGEAPDDRPAFGQITTTTTKPTNRRPTFTENKDGKKFTEIIDVDPESWADKVKQMASMSRARKILDPVGYENAKKRHEYAMQDLSNRRLMGATYAYVSQIPVESEAYRCRQCNGAPNGGNEQMPSGRESEQKLCGGCFNTGHTLIFPHQSITNLREGIENRNHWREIHHLACDKVSCNSKCLLKPVIDENVRSKVMNPREELVSTDVKGKPSGNRWIDNFMRPRVLSDRYRPIAPGVKILGGHGTSPIKKYDVCHFINFDTNNPNGNLGGEVNPNLYTDNEHVFNAGGGGRDVQMFAIVHSVSDTGANIIYTARPIERIREEKKTRTKGRRGTRNVNFSTMSEAVNSTAIEDQNKRGVRDHIVNAMDRITPFLGKPSPLQTVNGGHDARYIGYLENVPFDRLHRVDDISASMLTYQGIHRQIVKKSRIRSRYRDKYNPLTDKQKNTDATVDLVSRGGTGLSVEELRNFAKTTNNSLVLDKLNQLGEDHDRDLAAVFRRNNFNVPDKFLEESSWVSKRPGEEISATDQDMGGHDWTKFQTLPNSTYNSGGTVLDENGTNTPDLELPGPPVPPKIHEMLSTQEGTEDMLRVISESTGQNLSSEQKEQAIEGVRRSNHLKGGFAALGIPWEEDQE